MEIVLSPSFWELMNSMGGEWLWNSTTGDKEDMTWFTSALAKGTAMLAADGSYNAPKSTEIYRAGWIICCKQTGKCITGWAYERSITAGSYRGELLGLKAVHALTATAYNFFKLDKASGTLIGDSKSALWQAKRTMRRIQPTESQSDILQAIRAIKQKCTKLHLTQVWVKSHVEKHTPWNRLSPEQQLNTMCNKLAKQAVAEGVTDTTLGRNKLLTYRPAAVLVNGTKVSAEMAKELRHQISKAKAQRFYTKAVAKNNAGSNKGGLGWDEDIFDSVDWKAQKRAMTGKPEMYSLWLTKQEIGIC